MHKYAYTPQRRSYKPFQTKTCVEYSLSGFAIYSEKYNIKDTFPGYIISSKNRKFYLLYQMIRPWTKLFASFVLKIVDNWSDVMDVVQRIEIYSEKNDDFSAASWGDFLNKDLPQNVQMPSHSQDEDILNWG